MPASGAWRLKLVATNSRKGSVSGAESIRPTTIAATAFRRRPPRRAGVRRKRSIERKRKYEEARKMA
jgi:hypothetical protein